MLQFRNVALIALLGAFGTCFDQADAQKASVELEIYSVNSGLETQQTWGELLSKVGANISSLKSARKNVKMEVDESTFGNRKHYRIVGVLSNNRLNLPGGKTFTNRDNEKIAAYIEAIRADGPKTALSQKMAFGLTATQLVALQQDLAALHKKSTKDTPVMDVVEAIAEAIKTPVRVDSSARDALAKESKVAEEMNSLSCGTTLAAVLRPIGLVAVPKREQGKTTEIVIMDSLKADEHWPVGWPSTRGNALAVPSMFKSQKFEIRNYELKKILDALESKVKVPFLYDHNTMARHGADPTKLTATVVEQKQTFYGVVRKCLSQVRPQMKPEVRLDEAGNPFLWITTFKK